MLPVPKQAARRVARECPGVEVRVFSDRDVGAKSGEVEAALHGADAFFGSLLFDFDQVGPGIFCPMCMS
jgi:magnesium chelatase subunit H